MRPSHRARGSLLISVLVITALLTTLGLLSLDLLISQNNATNFRVDREKGFQIAEAGVDYYRWHLAHVPDDYQDGTGAAGPYVHTYTDAVGNVLGTYTLTITPPASGSTVVTIKSIGMVTNKPTSARTVVVKQGIPSFTQYAVVANASMRFGEGTEVFGPIHSNGGIRFDGVAHNLVTSALSAYDDPDHSGGQEFGVHTHVNAPPGSGINDTFRPAEAPPSAVPSRIDVFQAGRQFPVPTVDFSAITSDLAAMKTKAQASGIFLLPSGGQGYHLTLRTDGKVDMRVVNTQLRCQYKSGSGTWTDYGFCSNDFNTLCTQDSQCSNGGTCRIASLSVGSRSSDQAAFTYNSASSLGVAFPANGIIYAQDDIWVDGQVNNGRLTIVAAKEPLATGTADIILNNDLKYTNYNGKDAIGLIAQQDILVGFFSKDTLRIDAALIAQNGRVGRPYYGSGFTSSTTNTNFQLYPTGGSCTNNASRTCSADGDCNNFCAANTSRACTGNANCNNYCQNNTSRACTGNANCNNYCQNDTAKTCTATGNCINYCTGDMARSCTANNLCNGYCQGDPAKGAHNANDCKNYCQGDRTKSCTTNANCTGGTGPCVTTSTGPYVAASAGTCVTTSKGPCVTGDSCVLGDSCVTGDTCSISRNPSGGTTCQEYRKRASITTFGAIATNQRYGFAWVGNLFSCADGSTNDSGYCLRSLNFDSNLTYAPPPSFPTTGQYSTLSWEEQ